MKFVTEKHVLSFCVRESISGPDYLVAMELILCFPKTAEFIEIMTSFYVKNSSETHFDRLNVGDLFWDGGQNWSAKKKTLTFGS